jgi:hypothetical protein
MYWKESEMTVKEIDADTSFYEVTFTFALDKELLDSDDVEKDGVHNLMTEIHMKTEDYLESLGISVIQAHSSGSKVKDLYL